MLKSSCREFCRLAAADLGFRNLRKFDLPIFFGVAKWKEGTAADGENLMGRYGFPCRPVFLLKINSVALSASIREPSDRNDKASFRGPGLCSRRSAFQCG
jgi:hypothetical protein